MSDESLPNPILFLPERDYVTFGFRDCNPGVDFSIPGFGIAKMPISGSRDPVNKVWAHITTAYGHVLLSSDHSFHCGFTYIGECDGFGYIFSYRAHRKHNIFLIVQCTSSTPCHFTCSKTGSKPTESTVCIDLVFVQFAAC